MRKVLKTIDSVTEWTGRTFRWGLVLLVAIVSYEVIARYAFGAPTKWSYETDMMLSGTVYAFAWAYAVLHRKHVRIDVFYGRLSPRGKAVIDIIGTLVAFFPLIILYIYISAFRAWDAYVMQEVGMAGYWYPPLWPYRSAVALGFILLLFQGSAQFYRDIYMLARNKSYD
jgi:TRAP-type mannitol/chloroaromatic compound transport system permease small subunit